MSILKSIFGSSKEIWQQFADEIGGEYIDGGFWKTRRVVGRLDNWTVVFDTFSRSSGKHSTTYTRIRSPFRTRDGLKFKLRKRGVFSNIGKILGAEDAKIGDLNFDEKFIIKGNDGIKIKELFSSDKIRELILKRDRISLEIKDGEEWFSTNLVKGAYGIYFESVGVIKDIKTLRDLYLLFILLLEQLFQIGSASKDDFDKLDF